MKTIWYIIKALVTAPDVLHWIKKYEAMKKENQRLQEELNETR